MKKLIRNSCSLFILSCALVWAFCWSFPAAPAPREINRFEGVHASPDFFPMGQPDGTDVELRQRGDERYHWMEDRSGYTVLRNPRTGWYEYQLTDAAGRFISSGVRVGADDPALWRIPKGVRERPEIVRQRIGQFERQVAENSVTPVREEQINTTGTVKKLVILANFSNTSFTYSQSDFNGLFNTIGYNSHGANGSVRDYYLEDSYGALTLVTEVSVIVNLPGTRAYYGANDAFGNDIRPRQMIIDAIDALDATGFNFAPFDTDSNGWIDAFAVIHQGKGEEAGGGADTIWSHKWGISPKNVDGIWISTYYTAPEQYSSYISTIGVYAHEFGHSLGLPDLYDTNGGSEGVGNWCLMSGGSWTGSPAGNSPAHMLAWCKGKLGWVTPTVLSASDSDITVNRLSHNAQAYRLDYGMPAGGKEYYLIENRQKTGFDSYLPGSGLIITHIDENKTTNQQEDATPSSHYMVSVVQADGAMDLENDRDRGDSSDPFPGFSAKFELNPTTNPSTDRWDGTDSNIWIFEISNSANAMTFSLSLGGPPAGSLQVNIIPASAVSAGAKWRRVGTTTWRDSGYTESGLPLGSAWIEYLDTATWAAPSSAFAEILNGETTVASATYTLKTGSLKVDISPAAAVSAGAQWRRTGTSTWLDSGATESGIAVGSHTVEFKAVTDWNTPANKAVTITHNATTNSTGTYTAPPGDLTVTISPQAAIDAGAQWRRVGTSTWFSSGDTEEDVEVGDHSIEFKDTATWAPPDDITASIASNQTTSKSATYTEKTGSLTVNLSPAAAVSGGAQWRRAGTSTWLNSGATDADLPVGVYTLEYMTVSDYDTPTQTSATVTWNTTATVNAAYTVHTGSVLVTIAPAEAVSAGAQWRRVGTETWRTSGVVETGVPVGDYTIEFREVAGWDTPLTEEVTVVKDTQESASGLYVRQYGSLTVTIGPSEALTAGAAWRRIGTETWLVSGDTEDPVAAGSVTIEFKEIDGWGRPSNETVSITKDTLTSHTATYVECVKNYDVNKDGSVTPGDALMVFKHYLGTETITDACSLIRADANGDGSITPGDALVIFKAYLGAS